MCFKIKVHVEENNPFKQALSAVSLSAEKRTIIEERYINLLNDSHERCRTITSLYNTNRVIITIGSIIVPALISIEYTTGSSQTLQSVHWLTWIISLMVTISNGMMTMFKFDKKYYILHTCYEQLKSEGWQYLALTGQYKHAGTNHEHQFPLFCRTIEKIRMRQMEEEYLKIQEVKSSAAPNSVGTTGFDIQKSPSNDDMIVQITKIIKEQLEKKDEAEVETAENAGDTK